MVIEVSINREQGGRILLSCHDAHVILHGELPVAAVFEQTPTSVSWFGQRPILRRDSGFVEATRVDVHELAEVQNEVNGICVRVERGILEVLAFSARIARPRIYYCRRKGAIYLSSDLRALFPFSEGKVDKESLYGILKFGEAPEDTTVIRDIRAIPASRYLHFTSKELRSWQDDSQPSVDECRVYQHVKFPQSGGDLQATESELLCIMEFLQRYRPGIMLSGGVDSSLLNYLYNEVATGPYPAFYFDFNEAPREREYLRTSLGNTKADLVSIPITSDDFIERFERSVRKLTYPVYDNGSVLVGHIFSETLHDKFGHGLPLIDGTLADSCYGVRDYSKPLVTGGPQPMLYSFAKEWLYCHMELRGRTKGRTPPRDSFLNDAFLQEFLWYGGVYVNLWFDHARQFTRSLRDRYYQYIDLLDSSSRNDYWARYTIMKMMLYAGRQTTAKTYEMLAPNQVYFPFMFKAILKDQGRYSWSEKSEKGIVKAPLKKILSRYAPSSFVYRDKKGLQSQTRAWINLPPVKKYFEHLIFSRKDSLAHVMMRHKASFLRRAFLQKDPPAPVLSLVMSLAVAQYWVDCHGISATDEYTLSS